VRAGIEIGSISLYRPPHTLIVVRLYKQLQIMLNKNHLEKIFIRLITLLQEANRVKEIESLIEPTLVVAVW
jgi:hypothetical protein